jgi:hypothetical protein
MNMKHIIILTIFTMILVSFISSASFPKDNSIIRSTVEEEIVFIDYITATWCPQCPGASETVYDLYNRVTLDPALSPEIYSIPLPSILFCSLY